MGRNTARGNDKRKPPRDQSSPDRPERERSLDETKSQARQRIARASAVIERMSDWAGAEFDRCAEAGDLDRMQRLQDFLTRMIRQDMQILTKKLNGYQGRKKGVNGASAPAQGQGERSLDAFSA